MLIHISVNYIERGLFSKMSFYCVVVCVKTKNMYSVVFNLLYTVVQNIIRLTISQTNG